MHFRFFSFFVVIIGFVAAWQGCSSAPPEVQPSDTLTTGNSVIHKELSCRFVEVQMPNSRLRITPDLQGGVVEIFGPGTILRYMDDSTIFTTPIEMRGKTVHFHWYKCRAGNGNTGWMYGGIIRFLSEQENQKFSASCLPERVSDSSTQVTVTQPNNNRKPAKIETADQAAVQQYQSFLQRLNTRQYESVGRAVQQFEVAMSNANDPTCDAAFAAFWSFFETAQEQVATQFNVRKYNHLHADIRRYGKATMREDSALYRLAANGFDLGANDDETVFLRGDMDFLMRHFYRFVSPSVQAFLEQSKKEMQMPLHYKKLAINDLNAIADRAVFWENLLAQHPNFILYSQAKNAYKKNISFLLTGTEIAPAFGGTGGVLSPDFRKNYAYIQEKYPQSSITKTTKEYLTVLEGQNFKYTDVTRRFVNAQLQ